jgi:hypothetical protein
MALHGSDESLSVYRFHEEVTPPLDGPSLLVRIRRYDHDGYVSEVRLAAHAIEERPAIEAGHVKIEQHYARPKSFPDLAVRVLHARRRRDIDILCPQQHFDGVADVVMVVDD